MGKIGWETRDAVLMAVLGVLFAAVYLGVFYLGMGLSGLLSAWGLGSFGFEVIYGIWFMAATCAMYIIRRPGAALVTELLAAGIELLMGNSGGLVVLLTGLIQGLGCELGFAVFRYRRFSLLSMAVSGVFAALFIFVFELFYLQYYLIAPWLLAAQLLVRCLSAIAFSGVVTKKACDMLARAGVLKDYAIARDLPDPQIEA